MTSPGSIWDPCAPVLCNNHTDNNDADTYSSCEHWAFKIRHTTSTVRVPPRDKRMPWDAQEAKWNDGIGVPAASGTSTQAPSVSWLQRFCEKANDQNRVCPGPAWIDVQVRLGRSLPSEPWWRSPGLTARAAVLSCLKTGEDGEAIWEARLRWGTFELEAAEEAVCNNLNNKTNRWWWRRMMMILRGSLGLGWTRND